MDPYARRAVVLGPKEFYLLFDADGNPRIVRGPARVFRAARHLPPARLAPACVRRPTKPPSTRPSGSRIIAPIPKERLALHRLPPGVALDRDVYPPGHEMIVRGQPSVLFPFIEGDPTRRRADPRRQRPRRRGAQRDRGVDQKSGVYVRDLRTGMVKMVCAADLVPRRPALRSTSTAASREQWNLWISRAEPKGDPRRAVTTPWAISFDRANNGAVLITSRTAGASSGDPKVALLGYERTSTALPNLEGPLEGTARPP